MTGRYKSAIDEAAAELARLSDTPSLRAILFSPKSPNFCPEENRAAMFLGVEFNVLPEPNELFRQSLHYDVCIVDCHDNNEETVFMKFRSGNLAKLYFAWLWDNHHHPLHSFRTAMLADVVFVAHWRVRVSFNHPGVLPGAHMPACARQWSPALISRHYPKGLPVERSNALYGGYGHYDWAPERNALITRLRQRHPVSAVSSTDLNLYWRLPVEERLRSWVSHKVHLAIPIANDLSSRVFDALITGQIPLVPDSVTDLDLVVPPGAQAQLPILRYRANSLDSIDSAYREAIQRFDSDGAVGVKRRYDFVREEHSLSARLEAFARFIRTRHDFKLGGEGGLAVWQNWI